MLPPILVELKANSREFVAGMHEAQREVQHLGTSSAAHMQKFAAVGKAALFGVGAVALTVGGFSVEMADKFETSHAKLVAALKGAGTSMNVWGTQIAAASKHMESLGYTNAQTEDTLAQLTIGLGDPAKALKVMSTAADLARAKNIDLATAGIMVARAMEGNSRALKQMGIDLPINAKSAENLKIAQNNLRFATEAYHTQLTRLHEKHKVTKADLETLKTAHDRLKFAQEQVNQAQHAGTLILDALNQRLGGQSQQYAQSFAGKVAVLKAQMEDLGVKIGLVLIPMLEKAATVTAEVVGWFEKHSEVAKILGIALGGVLVVAIGAYVVAMASAAVATIAATWPILAIIAAVAAVVVGIYELATHWRQVWDDVSGFVRQHALIIAAALAVILGPIGVLIGVALELALHWHAVWDGIKTATHAAWVAMRPVLEFVWQVGLLPIRLAVGLLILEWELAWRGITAATSEAWKLLKPVFGFIVTVGFAGVRAELKTFGVLWTAIWTVVQSVVMQVWDVLRPIFDAIQKGIGTVGKGINFVEGAAGKVGGVAHTLHIPGFASGTDYAPGGLAKVGELGPEYVDLPRGSKVYPHGTAPSGGDIHVHIEGNIYGASSREFARDVKKALLELRRTSGQSLGFT